MAENKAEKGSVAKDEEKVLSFWQENRIFEKTLEKKSPAGEFVFYDGPPFATGLPHPGTLLSSIVKDVFGRYKTMRGYHVERRWGWDCHGLPIENMVEKELGLKSKKDIENIGIEKFNEAAKASVLKYATEWKEFVDRVGRWVEFDGSYKTMDNSYIESVWWALKEINDKGLLYEGRKVLLYCPHCETPLAKAEIAMDNSYRDVTDTAVTIKFKVKNPEKHGLPENTHLLAWTTTPWTLPGNVALAVGTDIDYVLNKENLIVAKERLEHLEGLSKDVEKNIKGKDLAGIEYEPLFEIPAVKNSGKKAWYVAEADFVSTEEGTGIVHTAVIYGEEDYALGIELDLPAVPLLDASGNFNNDAPELIKGVYFKDSEDKILSELEGKGLVFEKQKFTHSYPHCYRCDTPLIYNALSSWFINIQKVKDKLIKLNEKINWVPEHLKHGRFLNNLKSAPDWTISRNRYWASPLPVWKCKDCKEVSVVGSLDELKEKSVSSGNKYFLMRHGHAKSNANGILDSGRDSENTLSDDGIKDVQNSAKKLKRSGIDVIITSPFPRAKDTALLVAKEVGISEEEVIVDERIGEIQGGVFDGKPIHEFDAFFRKAGEDWLMAAPEGGESHFDVRVRAGQMLYETDSKHEGKKILIVTHDGIARTLFAVASTLAEKDMEIPTHAFINTSGVREMPFSQLPHNANFELDLHRPYIDAIKLSCKCGGEMERIPEVVDCWVESGSMPFASKHYPFEDKKKFKSQFPADFIAEYIAQTRTWFYYMHVMATTLFKNISFKNVVSTGTILAADGSKLSKSKKNYTDPLENFDRYGADSLRYYLMTSVVMQSEDLRFTDEDVKEAHNRVLNILRNVLTFYKLYEKDLGSKRPSESKNVLDKWILARLNQLASEMTEHMDAYNTIKAGRPVRDFVTDLSTWYLRRSRSRFKEAARTDADSTRTDAEEDKESALSTTRHVLLNLSKLIAPLMPFLAEHIYKEVGGEKESVHLEEWLEYESGIKNQELRIIEEMEKVRRIVSLGLEARAAAGVKVRQPLSTLTIKEEGLDDEYASLIQDEVNVKSLVFSPEIESEVELDARITGELGREGQMRELLRNIQDMRKEAGLQPSDPARISVGTDDAGKKLINLYEEEIRKVAGLTNISFEETSGGKEVEIDGLRFTLSLSGE